MESLLDFLKKYSDVDTAFIGDFIDIQNGDKTHEPFKIDLDVVAKWLNTRKDDLKDTLKNSYVENVNYLVIRVDPGQRKRGGHNKEIILLTSDCFKMLCMRSKTKNAEKIRHYYLTLEKLVEIYKDDIIKNQKKRIEQLENNLKKPKFPVKGAVYIISIEDGYKIGKTNNMNKRYELYKNAHKDNPEIRYVFYTSDIDQLETCLKNSLRYEEYRDRKEFYIVELADLMDEIDRCDDFINGFDCKSCNVTNKMKKFRNHIDKHDKSEKIRFYAIGKKKDK
jgi:hypothetical protein